MCSSVQAKAFLDGEQTFKDQFVHLVCVCMTGSSTGGSELINVIFISFSSPFNPVI